MTQVTLSSQSAGAGQSAMAPEASGAAPEVMVRATGLGKRYRLYARPGDRLWEWFGLGRVLRRKPPEDFWAVRDLSLELRRGECMGILGANGSGKSTLLKMLTGALHPTTGSFNITGRVLSLIELGTGLNPVLTGRENIHHSATLLGFPREYTRQKMPEIEAFAELGEFFDRQVNVYSSGMRVRLAFSMFACFRPDLFIVDEALSVGDVFFQQKCIQRLKEMLAEGMTMLFVSHDQSAVLNLCHRAIVMSHGRAIFEGRPEEAVSRYISALRGGNRYAPARSSATLGGAAPVDAAQSQDQIQKQAELIAEVLAHDVIGERHATRHGTGLLRVIAARVLNAAGHDALHAAVGETLTFRLVLEAFAPIAAPRCSIRLFDRFGNLIFGGGTANATATIPPMNQGDRVAVDLRLTMDVEHGEYTFGVGAGEPDPADPAAGIHHDRIELLGPLGVHLPLDRPRPFFGMARLPLKAQVHAIIPASRGPQ